MAALHLDAPVTGPVEHHPGGRDRNRHRFRLSRTGNRQLNAAIHRIAITQAHYHPQAREMLQRRRAGGDSKAESIRVLKRRLSDVVYRALLADVDPGSRPRRTVAPAA
ncbi:hypothetical protein ACVGOW_08955 [Pseudonocardia saturnea]